MAALGRREDAEDVAQESFVAAWRKLGGFQGQSTFRTWLLTIVWRRAIDRRRSASMVARSRPLDEHDSETSAGDRSAASPERLAMDADLRRRVAAGSRRSRRVEGCAPCCRR
jgi:RNA polymerase sigma-70 factor (ECF subfamily)